MTHRSGCPHPDINSHTKISHCSIDNHRLIQYGFVLLKFYFMPVFVGMRATRPTGFMKWGFFMSGLFGFDV